MSAKPGSTPNRRHDAAPNSRQAEPAPNSRRHDAAPNSRIGWVGGLGFYLAAPSFWGEKIKFSPAFFKRLWFPKAKPLVARSRLCSAEKIGYALRDPGWRKMAKHLYRLFLIGGGREKRRAQQFKSPGCHPLGSLLGGGVPALGEGANLCV